MKPYSVTCFGVGDGMPCPDRNHSSFLYRFGNTSLLLDCGEPVDSRFKAARLSYDLIDSIVLSHLHADHIGGFLMLVQPDPATAGAPAPLGNHRRAARRP